jgi:hypothetical protein
MSAARQVMEALDTYSVTRSLKAVPVYAWLTTSLLLACSQSPGNSTQLGGGSPSSGSSSGNASSSGSATSSSGSGSSSSSGGSSGSGAATGDADAIVDAASAGDAGAAASGCDPTDAGDAGDITAAINNTGPWNDTSGTHIQAHGGGFIKVCDTWYWFGEDKTLNTNGTGNFHAISCYASKDLVH